MFDITEEGAAAVYERLKDRYALTLTNTFAVDDGFRTDMPILTACAHDRILWLYVYEGEFVLDVMDAAHTMGTHRHPMHTEQAVRDVTAFMEGTEEYPMSPFPQQKSSP